MEPGAPLAHSGEDRDLGSFESVGGISGHRIPELCARQIALTVQRVSVLSALLAERYAADGEAALVQETRVWDGEAGASVVSGQAPTALARLEGQERDRLDRQIAMAARLGTEHGQGVELARQQARQVVAALRGFAVAAGLGWTDQTREWVRVAVERAFEAG